jgi:NADPH-dependent ferric siderophore reductase
MAVQQPETIEVAAVEVRRTPSSLVRVVFGGGGLAGFAVSGVPAEACLLHLPLADGAIDEHGRWYGVIGYWRRDAWAWPWR